MVSEDPHRRERKFLMVLRDTLKLRERSTPAGPDLQTLKCSKLYLRWKFKKLRIRDTQSAHNFRFYLIDFITLDLPQIVFTTKQPKT
jgi:hypothetical protein